MSVRVDAWGAGHPAPGEPALGILMLDTRFPRPIGDVGNAASFNFPVRYAIVQGASPERVVHEHAQGLLQPFIAAGQALIAQGCICITTTCGLLVRFQTALAQALPVPVMTSSLLQIAALEVDLPVGKRIGVVTIAAAHLDASSLAAAGARADTPIEGVDAGSEFAQRILNNDASLDIAQAERDVVAAAMRLTTRCPQVGALVLECTNMPPYRNAVQRATGLRVVDAQTAISAFWASLAPAAKSGWQD